MSSSEDTRLGTDDVAVRALFCAATELSPGAASELARRISGWVLAQEQNLEHDLHPLARIDARYVEAIRVVARELGRPPSTTEYREVYRRRRAAGDNGLPAISSIVKHFDGWMFALAAAGLEPAVPSRAVKRLRRTPVRQLSRYTARDIVACLRACAEDVGVAPNVREYTVWRESVVAGRPGRRPGSQVVPHYNTIFSHFHTWKQALEASGLSPES